MKALKILTLIFLSAGLIFSIDKAQLIAAVKNLQTACSQPDFSKAPHIYAKAAELIVYLGSDPGRRYKYPADYFKAEDQQGVDQICSRINRKIGEIHTYGAIEAQTKRGQSWHAIKFTHTKKGKERENLFAFVEINGKLYLGDID